MKNNRAFLFDLDGVIIDTEPQYDVFWKKTAEKYRLGIENFERVIKGTILPNIMATYFSHLPEKTQQEIVAANQAFELQMEMIPVPGALTFLDEVKRMGIKTGLVTSSDNEKIKAVFRVLPIENCFDTIVSANRIPCGKPNPMCYLLAAEDLKIQPENCIVFEDSFNGIAAGNAAGMNVIGLSTTNTAESIRPTVRKVIPDFSGCSVQSLIY
jgi:HAD superfamily hydrolase (TIGR01509 family)